MSGIERIRYIDPKDLDTRLYCASLLDAALRACLWTEGEAAAVQADALRLLAEKTRRLTGGESSSVPVETAQHLMESNLFTVGVALKTYPHPDDGAEALRNLGFSALSEKGRRQIDIKLKTARQLQRTVLHTLTDVGNRTYHDTAVGGIRGFFKLYDPDFRAQEIGITADYPLCNDLEDTDGIEFMTAYLDALVRENRFCACFPKKALVGLFLGFDRDYRDLIFNLFEQVLTTALGCVLAGEHPTALSLTGGQVHTLQAALLVKNREALGALLSEACQKLLSMLEVGETVAAYVRRALPRVTANVAIGLETLTLERVFLVAASTF